MAEDAKARSGDVADWQGKQLAEEVEKDAVQRQHDEFKTENSTLKTDLTTKQGEIEQLKVLKTKAENQLAAGINIITRLKREDSTKKTELNQARIKIEYLERLRKLDTTNHARALADANAEIEELRRQMDNAIRDERASTAAARQANNELYDQLSDMREKRNDCEMQYLEATSRETILKIERKHANIKIERQGNNVTRLEQTLVKRDDRISELEGQIAGFREQVKGANTEGHVTNIELTAVRQQLTNTQEIRDNLRLTLAERDRVLQLWHDLVFKRPMKDVYFPNRDIPAILDHLKSCLSQPWNVNSVHIKRSAQQCLSCVNDNSDIAFVPRGTVPTDGLNLFLQAVIHPQELGIDRLRYLISLLATSNYHSEVLGYLKASLEQLASIGTDADHLNHNQSGFFVRGCEFLLMNLFPGRILENIKALWLRTVDRLSLDIVMQSISQWIGCQIENVKGTRGQVFFTKVQAMSHLQLSHDTIIAAGAEDRRVFIARPGEIIYVRTLDEIEFNIDAYRFVWTIAVEGFPALSLPMNGDNMTAMAAALPGFDLTRWMR